MKSIIAWLAVVVIASTIGVYGQNTVTFDNQSGEQALVKLIGPTSKEVDVPNGAQKTVDATAGRYTIAVRYGREPNYQYTKGDEFDVKEADHARSETTITLHKVIAGNYEAHPISQEDFLKSGEFKTVAAHSQTGHAVTALFPAGQTGSSFESDDKKRTITLAYLGGGKRGNAEWKEEKPLAFGMAPLRYEVFTVVPATNAEESSDTLIVGFTVNKGSDINVLLGDKCGIVDVTGSKQSLLGVANVPAITPALQLMVPAQGGLGFYVPPDMMEGKMFVLAFPIPSQMSDFTLTGIDGFSPLKIQWGQNSTANTRAGILNIKDAGVAKDAGITIDAVGGVMPDANQGRWIVASDTSSSLPQSFKQKMDFTSPIPRPTAPFLCIIISSKGKADTTNPSAGARLVVGTQWDPSAGKEASGPISGVIQSPLAVQNGASTKFIFLVEPTQKDFTFLLMGVKPIRFSVR